MERVCDYITADISHNPELGSTQIMKMDSFGSIHTNLNKIYPRLENGAIIVQSFLTGIHNLVQIDDQNFSGIEFVDRFMSIDRD